MCAHGQEESSQKNSKTDYFSLYIIDLIDILDLL